MRPDKLDSPRQMIADAIGKLERVTAGEDVAFVSCRTPCDGTSAGPLDFRLTMGFEKRDEG